jgi:type II secretory pathway component PulM
MDEAPKAKLSTAAIWAERLRGRSRMAVACIGGVFLLGFLVVSQPLSQRIDDANARLDKAVARAVLGSDVYNLRKQAALYDKKLPRGVDPNDWTNYLLNGIRGERVRLIRMDPKDQLGLGPCKVLSWQIELEGDLESLGRVVQWLENGQRLVRIDRLVLQNPGSGLIMSLLVKGLALDAPGAQKTRPPKEPVMTVPVKTTAAAAAPRADVGGGRE